MDTSNWTVDDHINWIRQRANETRLGLEIAMNVKVTTMCYYNGITYATTDLTETMNKYRMMGVIK